MGNTDVFKLAFPNLNPIQTNKSFHLHKYDTKRGIFFNIGHCVDIHSCTQNKKRIRKRDLGGKSYKRTWRIINFLNLNYKFCNLILKNTSVKNK